MSDNFESTLINLGELSKPATVLVEKISDAIGGIFKPYQIVRIAKAEAQADRVRAENQIEISDLQRRAFHRFLNEQGQKQRNIEDITSKALPDIDENAKPNDIENDWITNFFDKCRLISDQEMQRLWSRVLAGEANSPGKYSKRTVNFLSALDKSDADLFTRLCGFAWFMDEVVPIVYDEQHTIYANQGIRFNELIHLESIGLLQFQRRLFLFTKLIFQETFVITYYGTPIVLTLAKHTRRVMSVGKVILTRIGQELAPICGGEPVPGFFDYVIAEWKELGYEVSRPRSDAASFRSTARPT